MDIDTSNARLHLILTNAGADIAASEDSGREREKLLAARKRVRTLDRLITRRLALLPLEPDSPNAP